MILVGSCRTGFSLKSSKRYKPTSPSSDVDVAVVSWELFDNYWDAVFRRAHTDRGWAKSKQGSGFVADLFNGWITPRDLPSLPSFADGKDWAEFFDDLTTKRTCGIRTISARLYRTWDRLEAYQEHMVRHCKSELRSI